MDWCGTACLLVRRRVFQELPEPWFAHPDNEVGRGSDIYFCDKARAAGFSIWVHTGITTGHMADVPIDLAFVRALEDGGGRDWSLQERAAAGKIAIRHPRAR